MPVLTWLLAFAMATLIGTGVGGGGLFLVYLTSVLGIEQLPAQALNLFFFLLASFAATLRRIRQIPWKTAMFCMLSGLPGVLWGAALRDQMNAGILRACFGVLLILTGSVMLFSRDKNTKENRSPRA